jgi:hypothetical protein
MRGVHFAADSIVIALDVAAQADAQGEPLVVPDGPHARRRSQLLEELIGRGWIQVERPNHGDDRLMSVHRVRLTEAGSAALASGTTQATVGPPAEAVGSQRHQFSDLPDDVRAAVEVVWSAFETDREWPIYDYFDRALDGQGMSAERVLSSMPRLGPMGEYGPLWSHTLGGVAQPDSPVGATVAGLAELPACRPIIEAFLRTIRWLSEQVRAVPLDRRQPQTSRIRLADLVSVISGGRPSADLVVVEAVRALLEHEPATWGTPLGGPGSDSMWEIPRRVTRFHDVADAEDYLVRVVELLGRPFSQAMPSRPEAFPAVPPDSGQSKPEVADWIDPGLWRHVAGLVAIENWDALVLSSVVYVEDALRRLGGRPFTDHGLSLVSAVLHPSSGSHPLGSEGHPEEPGGWHQLAVGLFKAVRNPAGHRLDAVDARYAMGVLGTASLFLTQMRRDHPAPEAAGPPP